jgi:hypothetical protein
MVEKTDHPVVKKREEKPTVKKWVKKPATPRTRATTVDLRCLFHTRVVVVPEKTATRTRYEVGPGQILAVKSADVAALLALEKKQAPGCCGGNPNPPALKYFELA